MYRAPKEMRKISYCNFSRIGDTVFNANVSKYFMLEISDKKTSDRPTVVMRKFVPCSFGSIKCTVISANVSKYLALEISGKKITYRASKEMRNFTLQFR